VHTLIGDVIAIAVVVAGYRLFKSRKFDICPKCRGVGRLRRTLGPSKTCRRCKGTGYGTRASRRAAGR